ncbi:MAG: hypothetical protein A2W25_11895 [candidate division Zixibacteria bacterium RBG_16_53_22]|nr:MAG: hypothetical protein A2W25_11895 [candidate division Zixibacteria bacterium RBG_16_53_22]
MPAKVEACVSSMMGKWRKDPKSRPKPMMKDGKPQDMEGQAWAICQASMKAEQEIEAVMLEGVGPVILGIAATNRPHLPLPPMSIVELTPPTTGGASTPGTTKRYARVPFLRQGIYSHPQHGNLVFNDQTMRRMLDNHRAKVNHHGVSLDVRHKPELGALAWFNDAGWIQEEDDPEYGKLLVGYGPVERPETEEIIGKGVYKYASVEFHPNYESNIVDKLSADDLRAVNLEELLQEVNMEFPVKNEDGTVLLSADQFTEYEALKVKVTDLEAKIKPPEPELPEHVRVLLERQDQEMKALKRGMLASRVEAAVVKAKAYRDANGCGHAPVLLEWATNVMQGRPVGEGEAVIKLEGNSDGAFVEYVNRAVARLLETLPGQMPMGNRTEWDDVRLETPEMTKEDFKSFWKAGG